MRAGGTHPTHADYFIWFNYLRPSETQYFFRRPNDYLCFSCGRVYARGFIPPTNACVPVAHTLPVPITLYGFDYLRPSETFSFRRPLYGV
ncbi:hypothetical protein [Neisseria zalophi]|uniref:hypothetical protein n=1 Tax=Neisseria zalophi TaxID=640030 RepID=UPI001243A3ED|nr:hypothetical protein [Neisseria zalophi]